MSIKYSFETFSYEMAKRTVILLYIVKGILMAIRRFFSGLMALLIAGVPMHIAVAEDQIVTEETQVSLIDMFKTDCEITDANYDQTVEYRYLSADGKTEKWYFSYLPEIDGLKRTNDAPRESKLFYEAGEKCDIREPHVHGYFNLDEYYIMPFDSEETDIAAFDCPFKKTKYVLKITPETLKVLHDFHLYRVCDNLLFLQDDLDYVKDSGYYGLVYLIPKKLEGDNFELDAIANSNTVARYDESMNGLLFTSNYGIYSEEPTTYEQQHFVLTK